MPIERKNSVGATNYATAAKSGPSQHSTTTNNVSPLKNPVVQRFHDIVNAIQNYGNDVNQSGAIAATAKVLDPVASKVDDFLFGKGSDNYEKIKGLVASNGSLNLSGAGSASGLSGGSSGGYSYGGSSGSGGTVTEEDPFDKYIKLVNETTEKNNAWSAEQAQKQMDFQKMMSDTAHQRETKDLIAAGLNPILSATGGDGASAASGAMATPDTSNTRLLAEAAMAQLSSIGGTAVQLATASGGGGRAANNFRNSIIGIAQKYVVPTLARQAANAVGKAIFRL